MGSADVSETGEERERLEPWLTDASLAVAVTLVISLVIAADAESSPLPGVAWAIGFGALLLLRHHLPLIVLAVTLIIAGGRIGSYLVRFRKLFPKLPRIKRKKTV